MSQVDGLPRNELRHNTLCRIRLTFSRGEPLRYVSHLDMHLVWERTLRRAGLPLAYTKGFNPNPRIHQAAALPLGFLSCHEITDFWLELDTAPDLLSIRDLVLSAAPPGIQILDILEVPLASPALQILVVSAEYTACPVDPIDPSELSSRVLSLLSEPSLPRERRGKPYDLRPLIGELSLESEQPPLLRMRLAAREGATGRPEEVILALDYDPTLFRVTRNRLILA